MTQDNKQGVCPICMISTTQTVTHESVRLNGLGGGWPCRELTCETCRNVLYDYEEGQSFTVPVCSSCGRPMDLRDPEKLTWFCRKDDTTFVTKGAQGTAKPAPIVSELEVMAPLLWLLVILCVGYYAGLLGLVVLICAAIYVHYNSKKFGIGGGRAGITLLFAIVGLPLYTNDLSKLRARQIHGTSQPETSKLPSVPAIKPTEAVTNPVTVLPEMGIDGKRARRKGVLLLSVLMLGASVLTLAYFVGTVQLTGLVPQTSTITRSSTDTVLLWSTNTATFSSTYTYSLLSCYRPNYYYSSCRTSYGTDTFAVMQTRSVSSELIQTSASTQTAHYSSRYTTSVPRYSVANSSSIAMTIVVLLTLAIIGIVVLLRIGRTEKASPRASEPVIAAPRVTTEELKQEPRLQRQPVKPVPTKFCRECGAKIPRDSIFCEECGTKLV